MITSPWVIAWCRRIRQAGREGSKRISPTTFGGTATIAVPGETVTEPASTSTPSVACQRSVRTGSVEHDAVAEPLGQPERDQLRAADDARVEAEVGLEQVLDAACTGDRRERAQHREGVGRLRHVAAGHERPQQVARQRVVDLGLEPLLEADRVELGRARVLPRCLGVELGGERVELGDGLLVGARRAGREDLVVAVVAVQRAVGVDVEVVALAVGVEELDPELGEQRVHLALVRARSTRRRARSARRRSRR